MKATADGTDGMKGNHGSAGGASPLYERPIGAANAALDAESAEVLETIEGLLA